MNPTEIQRSEYVGKVYLVGAGPGKTTILYRNQVVLYKNVPQIFR